MGRKTQITKDTMLQAAYEILKDDGYAVVNIKTIAAKVGCSTQPISWQFGNMQGLRKELYMYASNKISEDMKDRILGEKAMEVFFETGKKYISNAYEYPNVFRFLYVDDPGNIADGQSGLAELLGDDFVKEMLVKETGLTKDIVDKIVADIVIYTHGLATLLLWDEIKMEKEAVYEMIYYQAVRCFSQYGVDVTEYKYLLD